MKYIRKADEKSRWSVSQLSALIIDTRSRCVADITKSNELIIKRCSQRSCIVNTELLALSSSWSLPEFDEMMQPLVEVEVISACGRYFQVGSWRCNANTPSYLHR